MRRQRDALVRCDVRNRVLRAVVNTALLAAVGISAYRYWPPSPGVVSDSLLLADRAQVGRKLFDGSFDWASADQWIVMFVSSTCPACNKESKFLAELSRVSPQAKVLAISAEPQHLLAKWIVEAGIDADVVLKVNTPNKRGLFLTPTIARVDRNGIISDLVVGESTDALATEFRRRVVDQTPPAVNSNIALRVVTPAELAASNSLKVAKSFTPAAPSGPGQGEGWLKQFVTEPVDAGSLAGNSVILDCRSAQVGQCIASSMALSELGASDVAVLAGL